MQKTVISTNRIERKQFIYPKYIYILIFGVLIASIASPILYAISFYYISYYYMRDRDECKVATVGIVLGSLRLGLIGTYFYLLGVTLFYLITHILRLCHKNIYRSLPILSAVLAIPYAVYIYGISVHSFVVAFLIYALMKYDREDLTWIQKNLVFTKTMYGVLIFSIAYLFTGYVTDDVFSYILSIAFSFVAILSNLQVYLLLLFLNYITINSVSILPSFMVMHMLILGWNHRRIFVVFATFVAAYLFKINAIEMTLLALVLLVYIGLKPEDLPFTLLIKKQNQDCTYSQNMLNRQITNFSNIFQLLSQYYSNISDIEAKMLSNMSLALKASADAIKNTDIKHTLHQRIVQSLEGYHYEVQHLDIHTSMDQTLVIELDIRNIKKQEIRSTLLPLLEVLTNQKLKISEILHHRFTSGYHHITLEQNVPFMVDAYADSQRNYYESSGDSYSVFEFHNMVICMISDGMGNGAQAARSSKVITHIFQRMILSGIAKSECIKCINQLIQSDTYATLDVICFDCCEEKAYIFKSAACPTYLIRDHKMYEVSGSSLPVGIMTSIEPDCFVIDLKEGDTYFMMSDGIALKEVYEWLANSKITDAKEGMKACMSRIKRQQRDDDSTAVIACVKSRK